MSDDGKLTTNGPASKGDPAFSRCPTSSLNRDQRHDGHVAEGMAVSRVDTVSTNDIRDTLGLNEPTRMSPTGFEFTDPIAQRSQIESRSLRVMFLLTSMPVGGAETLLINLMRRMNPGRFRPELCCLKELGPLGEEVARTFPVSSRLIHHKYDLPVVARLAKRMRGRVDAVITVGAGDKMFWGRIAARLARVPVVLSALHSTGWPDGLGRLNRWLTPWTDCFIAVANEHRKFLIEQERLPAAKVHVIPNGVDTQRFQFDASAPFAVRQEFQIPSDAPLCGIVAALRPEKNHTLFLRMAEIVRRTLPDTHFLIVGDGPERPRLQRLANELNLSSHVRFCGNRDDVPQVLAALNVFCLTSKNEASPVSILEASSTRIPVVATDVGSVASTVWHERTGLLVPQGNATELAKAVLRILQSPALATEMGEHGRELVVQHGSIDRMVRGYEALIWDVFSRKQNGTGQPPLTDQVDFCGVS